MEISTAQDAPISELVFIRPERGLWVVVDAFSVDLGPAAIGAGERMRFRVPAQFETDLASIPWWARTVVNPSDPRFARAAIVHDAMLKAGIEERIAAGVFYALLRVDGVPAWQAQIMYAAVTAASSNW